LQKKKTKKAVTKQVNNDALKTAVVAKTTTPTSNNTPRRVRRTTISQKPNYSLNLWGIMKNCIGKELSKIPMPVSIQCL